MTDVLTGEWKGVLEVEDLKLPAVLVIARDNGDVTVSVRQAGGTHPTVPPTSMTMDGNRFVAHFEDRESRLEGEVNGDEITATVISPARSFPMTFRRSDRSFDQYEVPRLDAAGNRATSWTYTAPTDRGGWSGASASDVGVDEAGLVAFVEDTLADPVRHTDGIVVVHDGKLILDEYFWGVDAEAPHPLASITKSVTSMLAGIAHDRGQLPALDTPIHELLSDYTGTHWVDARVPITLRHVLTMSGALDWVESGVGYLDRRNDATLMESSDDDVAFTLNKKIVGRPGEVFAYTSGLSIVLGEVVTRAVGQDLVEFAVENLFGPLGIERFNWMKDPAGHTHTGGGLAMLPRDLAKLGQVMLNGGTWNGDRLLSEAWVRQSTTIHTRNPDASYGYQWWLTASPKESDEVALVAGLGWGGQRLYFAPGRQTVIVQTGANHDGDDARLDLRLVKHLMAAVGWIPQEILDQLPA